MKILIIIGRILWRGCALASVVELIMFLFASMMYEEPIIALKQFLLIAGFMQLVSLAQEILHLRRLHFAVRLGLHYLSLVVCFTVLFLLAGKIGKTPSTVFVYVAVFTLLYAVAAGILLPILRATGYFKTHLSKISSSASAPGAYEARFS